MGAFRSALAVKWVAGVEFDLQLTADGKLVVFHDEETGDLLEGPAVQVSEVKYEELRKRRFRAQADRHEVVPMLDDVLGLAKSHNAKVFVEMKGFDRSREMAKKVHESLEKLDMLESCVVISFNALSLYHFRQLSSAPTALLVDTKFFAYAMPSLPLVSVVDEIYQYLAMAPWAIPSFVGATCIGPSADLLTGEEYVARFKGAGYTVDTWTVNEKKVARRLKSCGVNMLTTDIPAHMGDI